MKKRIFVAINLPAEMKRQIESLAERLRSVDSNIKCVNPESVHLTLAFLGAVDEEEIAKITAISKLIAKNQNGFILELRGVGFFPSPSTPQVIWIGGEDNFHLINLQKNLVNQLRMSGFIIERRRFAPHLTIARIKNKIKNLDKVSDLVRDINLGKMPVSSIDIVESVLKKEGPEHKTIFKVNLKK